MSDVIWGTAMGGLIGFAGSTLTAYVFNRRARAEQRRKVLQAMLEGFYGPMLAMRSRIRTLIDLGLETARISGEVWPELFSDAYTSGVAGVERVEQIRKEHLPVFEKLIDYNNQQIVDQLLPAYRELVALFASKLHLAEPSTRQHLPELIRFVEIKERWLVQSLPYQVLRKLDHNESRLQALYDDLQTKFEELQASIKGG